MFNPYEPFQFGLIEEFIKLKRRWLVAQTFHRSQEAIHENKTALLLSHYEDQGLAQIHLNALKSKQDQYACIIDLENEKHRKKVEEMIEPLSKYKVYTSLVIKNEEVQERVLRRFSKNIRRYISNNTNWRIGGKDTLHASTRPIFGELFVLLKYNSFQELQVRLEEIEKS